jgi:hypothetical protein
MHPIFIQNFIHHIAHVTSNTIFFFGFNGKSLEDPSLELQMSKHPSTLGICTWLLRERPGMRALPPHLHFVTTYLPTYLPRTPTYSPSYYQGGVRFWHPLEAQTPTIIALYPIQHPCWVEWNKNFQIPFITNSFPNLGLHFGSSFFPHTN